MIECDLRDKIRGGNEKERPHPCTNGKDGGTPLRMEDGVSQGSSNG